MHGVAEQANLHEFAAELEKGMGFRKVIYRMELEYLANQLIHPSALMMIVRDHVLHCFFSILTKTSQQ